MIYRSCKPCTPSLRDRPPRYAQSAHTCVRLRTPLPVRVCYCPSTRARSWTRWHLWSHLFDRQPRSREKINNIYLSTQKEKEKKTQTDYRQQTTDVRLRQHAEKKVLLRTNIHTWQIHPHTHTHNARCTNNERATAAATTTYCLCPRPSCPKALLPHA